VTGACPSGKGLDAAGSFAYTERPPNPPTKKERDMSLRLGDTAPDFTAESTERPSFPEAGRRSSPISV